MFPGDSFLRCTTATNRPTTSTPSPVVYVRFNFHYLHYLNIKIKK
jgi:hypothetical protein